MSGVREGVRWKGGFNRHSALRNEKERRRKENTKGKRHRDRQTQRQTGDSRQERQGPKHMKLGGSTASSNAPQGMTGYMDGRASGEHRLFSGFLSESSVLHLLQKEERVLVTSFGHRGKDAMLLFLLRGGREGARERGRGARENRFRA